MVADPLVERDNTWVVEGAEAVSRALVHAEVHLRVRRDRVVQAFVLREVRLVRITRLHAARRPLERHRVEQLLDVAVLHGEVQQPQHAAPVNQKADAHRDVAAVALRRVAEVGAPVLAKQPQHHLHALLRHRGRGIVGVVQHRPVHSAEGLVLLGRRLADLGVVPLALFVLVFLLLLRLRLLAPLLAAVRGLDLGRGRMLLVCSFERRVLVPAPPLSHCA